MNWRIPYTPNKLFSILLRIRKRWSEPFFYFTAHISIKALQYEQYIRGQIFAGGKRQWE